MPDPTDLRFEFHDGTDNQVFHSFFYVGMSYFRGYGWAKLANVLHETQLGGTTEDLWAGDAGIAIGGALREGKSLKDVADAEGLDGVRETLEDEADPLYATPVTTANLAQIFRYFFTQPIV